MGAFQNAGDARKYFKKELANNAVLGAFYSNPFTHSAYLSPLNTRDKKDSGEKRIIINMSFPHFPRDIASMMESRKILMGHASNR